MSQRTLHLAQILWPAFVVACVLEMVVFAWVDPHHVQFGAWAPDAMTVYSLAFLTFWALVSVAAFISHRLMHSGPHDPARAISSVSC